MLRPKHLENCATRPIRAELTAAARLVSANLVILAGLIGCSNEVRIYPETQLVAGKNFEELLFWGRSSCVSVDDVMFGIAHSRNHEAGGSLYDVTAILLERELDSNGQWIDTSTVCPLNLSPLLMFSGVPHLAANNGLLVTAGKALFFGDSGSEAVQLLCRPFQIKGFKSILVTMGVQGGTCLDLVLPNLDSALVMYVRNKLIELYRLVVSRDGISIHYENIYRIGIAEHFDVNASVLGLVESLRSQVFVCLNGGEFRVASVVDGQVETRNIAVGSGRGGLIERWNIVKCSDGFAVVYRWCDLLGDTNYVTSIIKMGWDGSVVANWDVLFDVDWVNASGMLFLGNCLFVAGTKYNPRGYGVVGLRLEAGADPKELFFVTEKSGLRGPYFGAQMAIVTIRGNRLLAIVDPYVYGDASEHQLSDTGEAGYRPEYAALKLVSEEQLAPWIAREAWGD